MDPPPEQPPGILSSVRNLLQTVIAIVGNRVQLLSVEVREEVQRWLGAFLLVAALVALGTVALVLVTLTIVVACWEEYQLAALVGLSVVYLLAAVALGARLRWLLQNWPTLSDTLGELKKDKAWLEDKNQ